MDATLGRELRKSAVLFPRSKQKPPAGDSSSGTWGFLSSHLSAIDQGTPNGLGIAPLASASSSLSIVLLAATESRALPGGRVACDRLRRP
jgi:hypothetical protein